MKRLFILLLLCISSAIKASEIEVSGISFGMEKGGLIFELSWQNGWKNNRNHDAAWVFVKFHIPGKGYIHGQLASNGHVIQSRRGGPSGEVVLAEEGTGLFIRPTRQFRGEAAWGVRLMMDEEVLKKLPEDINIEVFAIEMVYIPAGGFALGDPDPKAISFNAFYKSDASGQPNGLIEVSAEDQVIQIGARDGALYYDAGRYPIYTGDQKGPVPATFPKGVQPFYIMKYETTQGLYTDFLNTLSADLAAKLSPHETDKYYEGRGSIKFESGQYMTEFPLRPCNFITWDDGAALADWAGLRPMTELEYTKAARGPGEALAHEFPWNTDNKDGLARYVDLDDELKLKNRLNESQLTEENRNQYGASYYWVMDLAGSLWEKCVSIGHPIGRNFRGSHGDGSISETGTATNTDWPKGINEEGGYGYRGGGYYQHGMKVSEFNPHSPIAYRRYGAWSGGKRSIAYSQRYVRTAPQ